MTVSPCPAGKLPWDQWLTFSDFIVEYGRKSENAGKLEAVIDIRTWPPAYGNGIRVIVRKNPAEKVNRLHEQAGEALDVPVLSDERLVELNTWLYDATIHSSAHNMTNVQQFQEHLLRADSERPRHKRFGLTVGNIDDRKYHIGTKNWKKRRSNALDALFVRFHHNNKAHSTEREREARAVQWSLSDGL